MNDKPLRSVLYVDDEPDIREIVQLALSLSPDLDVHTCESGIKALETMPLLRPDLVLLDVMMPGLDGPATFARMREHEMLRTIPVVFVTAKALPQEVDRFLNVGALGVISKPFDPMVLAENVLAIWRSAS
jgi:two-component system OmpR family response regulator